jgi:hypothetical protein
MPHHIGRVFHLPGTLLETSGHLRRLRAALSSASSSSLVRSTRDASVHTPPAVSDPSTNEIQPYRLIYQSHGRGLAAQSRRGGTNAQNPFGFPRSCIAYVGVGRHHQGALSPGQRLARLAPKRRESWKASMRPSALCTRSGCAVHTRAYCTYCICNCDGIGSGC